MEARTKNQKRKKSFYIRRVKKKKTKANKMNSALKELEDGKEEKILNSDRL